MFKKRRVKESSIAQHSIKRLRIELEEKAGQDVENRDSLVTNEPQLDNTRASSVEVSESAPEEVITADSKEINVGTSHATNKDDVKYKLSSNDDAVKEDVLNKEALGESRKPQPVRSLMSSKPLKGSSKKIHQPVNIRTTLLMDYQPDVCKDFKQTGYCGYGDSCKFLHSRDDFKTGWKLDQDWKTKAGIDVEKLEEEMKEIPFKCVICKNDYKRPVVTKCGHYFCSLCFTDRCKNSTNLFCLW
ncbi:hypothetical protein TPHA_0F00850 [Tetrapisispora phaffii CBS 4417]|uniref:Pre-mRNA-splicing factor CWC24 n=1 Tax=Tetrapisispora phaffii (strain ATCC 24235 / CBS 4417 / NBRC 1672 / NRRL Y-8282 / UCD 70-5) TaxID=1071381 RepID=G8BUY9_TETPH|nr:hypothetical protein TPHA_0F00850 [Tetrapisispora phaffii CBS 4417]CCE63571.1 hypothetical protein TPHA_0F00850 [Tetrapisispora phaffii CBS 4417]